MSVFRKQTSRKGSVVYQQVLQKNFQIIETFLKKFHQIFTKQDQFEQHLNKFASRFTEYDQIFDQFRQEQRLSIVMLQKKVNNMKNTVRQSHRASHRFSKINIPVFQAVETPEGMKSKNSSNEDYTLLKFDSIDNAAKESQEPTFSRKQSEIPSFSNKEFDQMKESVNEIKQEITQMKDKISFLSAYTSSTSNQENNKSKIDSIKKEIIETMENETKTKVQKQIRRQMMETEKVFIQQINNLAVKFSDQLTENIDQKYQKINASIQKFEEELFTNQQAAQLEDQLKKDMKNLASECMTIFSNKEQTKKYLSLLEKKVKQLQNQLKQQFKKTDEEKQQAEYFQSLLQVNSGNTQSRMTSLHKSHKSQSQFIKHKNFSSSVNLEDELKENTTRKTQTNVQTLSQGAFFTSKVSKQFMKNFGVKQRKLVKGNIQNFSSNSPVLEKKLYQESKQPTRTVKQVIRPVTAVTQPLNYS